MREMWGRPSGCHIGSIFWRPTTMFPDHENPSNIAAAAATAPGNSEASTPEEAAPPVAEQAESTDGAPANLAPAPAMATEVSLSQKAAAAANGAEAPGELAAAEAGRAEESAAAEEEAAGSEEMSKLMQEFDEKQEAAASHEVLEVKVVAYTEHGVVVDLGGKTEGLIPAAEFAETEIPRPDPNATIEVQRSGEVKDGYEIVSYQKVLRRRTWEKIDAAFKAKETITGKVVDRIKGGLVVDIGVRAFLPGSQYDLKPAQNLDDLLGTEVEVRVTKLNRRRGNAVVSRRVILEEALHAKRAALMDTLSEGHVVRGHVKNVTDYGAIVDLGHVSEMSWNKKIQHPSKVAKVGDVVDVVVLDIKPSDRRVSLGMKQAQPDPWLLTAEKYPVGTVITGKVRNIAEFGAFVEIEEGFDGLVHVGDVSWTGRVKNPHEVFKKGEPVTAKVLKIDVENRRVSLGVKQVNDIWGDWFKQHKVGQIVKGKVSRIATFGAFVELGENIEALCHNTEIEDRRRRDEGMGGYRPTTGPLKSAGPLEPGKEYDFKIIKISPETRRIGLSYRAAVKQLERREIEQYRSSSKSSSTATIGDALKSKLSARQMSGSPALVA